MTLLYSADDYQKLKYLNDIPFTFTDENIDILIGNNVPEMPKPISIIDGASNEPYATKYYFGWTMNGFIARYRKKMNSNKISISDAGSFSKDLENLFSQDFIDNFIEEHSLMTIRNLSQLSKKSTNMLPDRHYEVGL